MFIIFFADNRRLLIVNSSSCSDLVSKREMSRLLLLTLLSFVLPDAIRVFGKVHHIQRFAEDDSPTRITLKASVPMETDDVISGGGFGDESRRRFKRSGNDNERLIVNMTTLPDEGHNEAIVHWSGRDSLVSFLCFSQTLASPAV